jgi:Type IV secretion system pilin/Lysozyme like domain
MKRLTTLFFLTITLLTTPVAFTHAQGAPNTDTFVTPPITDGVIEAGQGFVPCSGTTCSPCDLVVLFNTLLKWFMGIAFLIFAILAMKAGVGLLTAGGKPGALSAAKKSFTNAFIGLIIILAAWLIVDTLMRGLLGGNGDVAGYGPWSQVKCAKSAGVDEQAGFFKAEAWKPGDMMTPSSNTPYTGGPLAQCGANNGACSVAALTNAGMSAQQAAIMSCIAVTESSGNANTPPYNIAHPGSNSTACGLFQITRTTWNTAASGACASFSNCQNATCNAQVAKTLVSRVGYTPWTCPGCNNKASRCVSQYGG